MFARNPVERVFAETIKLKRRKHTHLMSDKKGKVLKSCLKWLLLLTIHGEKKSKLVINILTPHVMSAQTSSAIRNDHCNEKSYDFFRKPWKL